VGGQRLHGVEVLQEPAGGQGVPHLLHGHRQGRDGPEPRLQHALPLGQCRQAHAHHRRRSEDADPPGLPQDRRFLRLSWTLHHRHPGGREPLRPARHVDPGRSRPERRGSDEVGDGRVPANLREAQEGMTTASLSGGPEPTARAAVVSLPVATTRRAWWRSHGVQRKMFGYTLLAPAALYVLLLVGAPFLFSLWLALSDATVGDPVARFVGLENFRAAWEMDTFWIAFRNSVIFFVVAAIFKSLLGTSLAFLLLQNFRGKKLIRGLVVIPFTLPIAISVLSWKWMYDSQFSVVKWVVSQVGLIGGYGSPDWPIWLGQPHLALGACIAVNVWRTFPFSAIVLLAGFTAVPLEVLDAAKVDGCS